MATYGKHHSARPSFDPLRRALLLTSLGAATARAANAIAPRALSFPRDFGAHNETRTEWWYATGVLDAPAWGEQFGFQLTFFRTRNDSMPREHPSRFAAKQLLFAHAALTDLKAGRLRHDQRIARWNGQADAQLAVASPADTHIALRGWSLQREGPQAGAPEASRYLARIDASEAAGFALALQLATTQPLLLQGEAGYSRKGPESAQASYYYSEPQLAVSGSLMRDGQRTAVSGRAWLDHEWSETLLPGDAVGWDWIGMNLLDSGALTAFRLRRADGSALWAGGSYRAAGQATVRAFGPGEVQFAPGRVWTSAATQAAYPVEWTLTTPIGRHVVRARLDVQELDARSSTGTAYWEGLSELLDEAGRIVGRGYLEMTGYAGRLRL